MKNGEILNLSSLVDSVNFDTIEKKEGDEWFVKLHYAIAKNQSLLNSETKAIQKAGENLRSEKFKKLQSELKDFLDKHTDKVESEAIKSWEKRKEWEKILEDYNKNVDDLLETENVNLKLFKVPYQALDRLVVNQSQMKAILPMLKEETLPKEF